MWGDFGNFLLFILSLMYAIFNVMAGGAVVITLLDREWSIKRVLMMILAPIGAVGGFCVGLILVAAGFVFDKLVAVDWDKKRKF
ncbi:hypothetical protein VPHK567_0140 [Vibrio phage K567]